MKAAVLYSRGGAPQVADVPEPMPEGADQLLVSVKAVALKHFDKSRAEGTHYSNGGEAAGAGDAAAPTAARDAAARVVGGDGICILPDGTRVYAIGTSGMMAEKATVERDRIVAVPAGLDDATAAALPNAVFGSAMALRFRAGIEPGDTVLINGATGFTGRVAIQLARHYGAGRIIATGRNPRGLEEVLQLGADAVLSTQQGDEAFVAQLQQMHRTTPLNVIVDYLWGHTAELILGALKGKGSFTPHTRFVSVGAVTGDKIQLSAEGLRSVDLQLSGSGLGSWTKGQVGMLFSEILPEMFRLAADGKLNVGTVAVPLAEIERLWTVEVPDGKRLVVMF